MVETGIDVGDPDRLTPVLPRIPRAPPQGIATAITWLPGSQTTYVTGAVLPIAGDL